MAPICQLGGGRADCRNLRAFTGPLGTKATLVPNENGSAGRASAALTSGRDDQFHANLRSDWNGSSASRAPARAGTRISFPARLLEPLELLGLLPVVAGHRGIAFALLGDHVARLVVGLTDHSDVVIALDSVPGVGKGLVVEGCPELEAAFVLDVAEKRERHLIRRCRVAERRRLDNPVDQSRHPVALGVSLSLVGQVNAEPRDLDVPLRSGGDGFDVAPRAETSHPVISVPIDRDEGLIRNRPVPEDRSPDLLRNPPRYVPLVRCRTAVEVRKQGPIPVAEAPSPKLDGESVVEWEERHAERTACPHR